MQPRDHASKVLLSALGRPASLGNLTDPEWDVLLRQARTANVLSRLALAAQDQGIADRLPDKVVEAFRAATVVYEHRRRTTRWEVGRVRAALAALETPILLLKGAAYEFAELPPARGRLASDVDIMVREDALADVEAALLDHGWQHVLLEPYDQRYFRSWMHELPPLVHRERGTELDVHHTILPRTSRLKPSADKLWASAVALNGTELHVLSPVDMVLHSAAHAFHDGEISLAIRDLADVHDLLVHFGEDPAFWANLAPRGRELDLVRPLYYALRYARLLLGTPVPEAVLAELATTGPSKPIIAAMDRLVPRALLPGDPDHPPRSGSRATLLLYVRSHWLKMPPLMLTTHLIRKFFKRKFGSD